MCQVYADPLCWFQKSFIEITKTTKRNRQERLRKKADRIQQQSENGSEDNTNFDDIASQNAIEEFENISGNTETAGSDDEINSIESRNSTANVHDDVDVQYVEKRDTHREKTLYGVRLTPVNEASVRLLDTFKNACKSAAELNAYLLDVIMLLGVNAQDAILITSHLLDNGMFTTNCPIEKGLIMSVIGYASNEYYQCDHRGTSEIKLADDKSIVDQYFEKNRIGWKSFNDRKRMQSSMTAESVKVS